MGVSAPLLPDDFPTSEGVAKDRLHRVDGVLQFSHAHQHSRVLQCISSTHLGAHAGGE